MKKITLITMVISSLFMGSCGSTAGYIGHSIDTRVVLSQANFKIIGSAMGASSASYILGIGPSEAKLYGMARTKLVKNANLTEGDKSRAIINVTTDVKNKYVWFYLPWYYSKTVYVSADIVEFQ